MKNLEEPERNPEHKSGSFTLKVSSFLASQREHMPTRHIPSYADPADFLTHRPSYALIYRPS